MEERIKRVRAVYGTTLWDERVSFLADRKPLAMSKGKFIFSFPDLPKDDCVLAYAYWLMNPKLSCRWRLGKLPEMRNCLPSDSIIFENSSMGTYANLGIARFRLLIGQGDEEMLQDEGFWSLSKKTVITSGSIAVIGRGYPPTCEEIIGFQCKDTPVVRALSAAALLEAYRRLK